MGSSDMLDPLRESTGRACSIYASLMTRWLDYSMVRFSIREILNFKCLKLLVNKTKLVGIYFALSSATILRCPASSRGNSRTLSSYGTRQQTQKAGSGKEAKGLSHSTFSRPTPLTLEFGIR